MTCQSGLDTKSNLVETPSYLSALRRMIRAGGLRVARTDTDDLSILIGLSTELDRAIGTAVMGLRAEGFTWESIGEAAGITRQAAQQRWGDWSE